MAEQGEEKIPATEFRVPLLDVAIDWDRFRRSDGTIDLEQVFLHHFPLDQVRGWHETQEGSVARGFLEDRYRESVSFLKTVESICRINSRQSAAIALGLARIHLC